MDEKTNRHTLAVLEAMECFKSVPKPSVTPEKKWFRHTGRVLTSWTWELLPHQIRALIREQVPLPEPRDKIIYDYFDKKTGKIRKVTYRSTQTVTVTRERLVSLLIEQLKAAGSLTALPRDLTWQLDNPYAGDGREDDEGAVFHLTGTSIDESRLKPPVTTKIEK